METIEASMKRVDAEFDLIFGARCDQDDVPISLLRTATKMIVAAYPSNRHRDLAITCILSGAEHLKMACTKAAVGKERTP